MQCNICNNPCDKIFVNNILNKHDVQYYMCTVCNFIQTETPYWLDEAYQSSINSSDTGLVARNIHMAEITTPLLFTQFKRDASFLDWGGGYGLFVRIMRDTGFDFNWYDPHSENLFAEHFQMDPKTKFDGITCFEVFEHLENPIKELEKILSYSESIIFSTKLHNFTKFKFDDKWDYFDPENGQHISFFALSTLQSIARKFDLHLYSNHKDLHILSRKKLSSTWKIRFLLGLRHRASLILAETIKLFMQSKTASDSTKIKTIYSVKTKGKK